MIIKAIDNGTHQRTSHDEHNVGSFMEANTEKYEWKINDKVLLLQGLFISQFQWRKLFFSSTMQFSCNWHCWLSTYLELVSNFMYFLFIIVKNCAYGCYNTAYYEISIQLLPSHLQMPLKHFRHFLLRSCSSIHWKIIEKCSKLKPKSHRNWLL